ncbi:cation:proton antiporter [Pseudalkalibacillus salsuginis]|uniref:cation:proton antiporter n=1 Tax=Pseudalkalibacillus salsuginis TaxID=2910972 RepID=UPI001F446B38|nr:sodium:proton antiporter [Pseudalkalibacillus salsuginis]MCF6410804.1 sodium:proton antiporter [Pseudalkalibacillus salsuginis]
MIESLLFTIMLIIVLGIGSQWLAWRFGFPAIVIMTFAGLLAGPFLGIINPQEDFGQIYNPIISAAVAIILFEGSLSLDYREIRGVGRPILRIISFGAFIAWILGSLAAHYFAGLSLAVAFVIGGLFTVTGPTVILPLLRQAKLKSRPAAILKWEGIIVDPLGALLAVFAFEIIQFLTEEAVTAQTLLLFFVASAVAGFLGWLFGRVSGWMIEKGHVPEFLKSPFVFAFVLACFSISDEIMHETGLLAVTAMGITMANMNITSIDDMRHFKETMSVMLISAVFIMITASLPIETLLEIFSWNILSFVILMMFAVRPLSIFLSTIGTDLSLKEKTLVGWIAPRGIVALTVSGYFAGALRQQGFEDARLLIPLTLGLVFATVCAHGFSIRWLASKLGLAIDDQPGVLLVGGSSFSAKFGEVLKELDIPVLITDSSYERLIIARNLGVPIYRGEILSEQTDYQIDLTPYEYMVASTDIDSYNALVCNTFVPTFGRTDVYQLSLHNTTGDDLRGLNPTVGGTIIFHDGATWEVLNKKVESGYVFRKTRITNQYTFEQYVNERADDAELLCILKPSGKIVFFTEENAIKGEVGDIVVSLGPPNKGTEKIREKYVENSNPTITKS